MTNVNEDKIGMYVHYSEYISIIHIHFILLQ